MLLLAAAVAALFAGPLVMSLRLAGQRARAFVDGFVFVTVAGLFLLGVIPESLAQVGPLALVLAAGGFLLPALLEHGFVRAVRRAHGAILLLGVLGLLVHQVLDGVALLGDALGAPEALAGPGAGPGDHDHGHDHDHDHEPAAGRGDGLALAVVLHNLPVGIAVGFLLLPVFGWRVALGVFALLAAGTVAGYFAGPALLAWLAGPAMAAFQAFLAGSILHVVLHGVAMPHGLTPPAGADGAHAHADAHTASGPRFAERLGALAWLGLLAAWW
jgi:zinc transporter ZupT